MKKNYIEIHMTKDIKLLIYQNDVIKEEIKYKFSDFSKKEVINEL